MSDFVQGKILEGNSWYTDNQRLAQLSSLGGQWALSYRWQLFGKIIDQWLVSRTGKSQFLRVLDAGCGDGINMEVLERLLFVRGMSTEITGCDYNDLRLHRASQDNHHRVLEVDLRATPFPDESFDVVLCSHVLEHIHDDARVMSELSRIVERKGLVIIAVPNEGCLMARLRNHVVQPSIFRTTDHCQFYTSKALLDRAERVGLTLLGDIEPEGFFLPHLGLYTRLRETKIGRFLIPQATRVLPSQAAGLVAGFRVASI